MTKEITTKPVPHQQRATFMPDLFTPQFFVIGEGRLYDNANFLSEDYEGGLWDFVQLSNDSGYAYPYGPQEFRLLVPGNGFEATVSAETYGIICTLFALSQTCTMAFNLRVRGANEVLAERYHALRDYVAQRDDRRAISAAID